MELVIICRETCKNTGKISVYPINCTVTQFLINNLSIRTRINPEIKYYVTAKENYNELKDLITSTLKRKNVSEKSILKIGNITQL